MAVTRPMVASLWLVWACVLIQPLMTTLLIIGQHWYPAVADAALIPVCGWSAHSTTRSINEVRALRGETSIFPDQNAGR